jgi:glycosyltransferase involved in cell wall biosynthesis
VIEAGDEDAVRKAEGGFFGIESVSLADFDRFYDWIFRLMFKGDRGNLLWTAVRYPRAIAFERRAWKQLRTRILGGEFDVVLRILPIVPMFSSPFAFFLRNGPIPFVLGPLNGGVPWPQGFSQIQRQRAAAGNWAARFRNLYRFLPFARSTFAKATAIICGSSHTCRELSRYRGKLFYVPGENGLESSTIRERPVSRSGNPKRLELVFAGRLVPYKACDIALRGAASLLRDGRAHLRILGEGQERQRLENLVDELGVRGAVTFCGMLGHSETLSQLGKSDVLVFPSLREFGGGVVFEALAMGAVPVVADHGGPGDIVTDEVGCRIPLTDETRMVTEIDSVLQHLASDSDYLERLRTGGLAYARKQLTWEAKASMVTKILLWAVGSGQKPVMLPPKPVEAGISAL